MFTIGDIEFIVPQNTVQKQNETWSKNVVIYQPLQFDQILLPDNANCLAIETLLRMCNIKHDICYKLNAEEMSPTGKVPFVKFGNLLVTDLKSVVEFLSNKDISLTNELEPIQKVDMEAYISLINLIFQNAEDYFIWSVDENRRVSKERYGSKHPFPLNLIKVKQKHSKVNKQLSAFGWSNKTYEEVLNEVELCCKSISAHISSKQYFFGNFPTELDALLFGHIFSILTTTLPNNQLTEIVLSYPKLYEHCKYIEETYYDDYNMCQTNVTNNYNACNII